MQTRIKKLSSWAVPVIAIGVVAIASVFLIGGQRMSFGALNPGNYSFSFNLNALKPFFASVSDSVQHFGSSVGSPQSPSQTSNDTVPSSDSGSNTPLGIDGQTTATAPLPSGNSPAANNNGNNAGTPATPPDLSIQIIDTGIIDNNNAFTHAVKVEAGQRGAVIFEVKNIGGSASGQWMFKGIIPISDSNYTSPMQESLARGEAIRFTMAFSNLKQQGNNTASFVVDPDNQVSADPNRTNNTVSAVLVRNY